VSAVGKAVEAQELTSVRGSNYAQGRSTGATPGAIFHEHPQIVHADLVHRDASLSAPKANGNRPVEHTRKPLCATIDAECISLDRRTLESGQRIRARRRLRFRSPHARIALSRWEGRTHLRRQAADLRYCYILRSALAQSYPTTISQVRRFMYRVVLAPFKLAHGGLLCFLQSNLLAVSAE
jgi:hypothetical protein